MHWDRLCRILGGAALALVAIAAFTPVPNAAARLTATAARLEPADAIVVLASGMYREGTLSNSSLRRALHGIVLHRARLAPILLFFGPRHAHGRSEADVRAELARRLGIPDPAVMSATGSLTTREEAATAKDVLQPRGIRRILLVTDSQHLRRARGVFERAGFDVLPAPANDFSLDPDDVGDRLHLTRVVLQEFAARLYYRSTGGL